MTISDIRNLNTLFKASRDDLIHVARKNEWGSLLSYKAQASSLSTVFEDISRLEDLEDRMDSLLTAFNALSAKFATKDYVDSNYASKEILDNISPGLLTYSSMEELTSKYVIEDKVKEKAASARQEAHRLADEMTDFVGAAMVGINQSGGVSEPPPSPGDGETG